MSGALGDVKVLDLSRLLPGGFCSLLMADLGAEVLKVEDTGMGDYVRWAEPAYEGVERSAASSLFLALNRGKRSARVNLKSEQGAGGAQAPGARARRAARVLPARACSTASAWATTCCARRTPGSSTARSPATARTAPTATARVTT